MDTNCIKDFEDKSVNKVNIGMTIATVGSGSIVGLISGSAYESLATSATTFGLLMVFVHTASVVASRIANPLRSNMTSNHIASQSYDPHPK